MIQKFSIDINLDRKHNTFQVQQDLSKLVNTKIRKFIDDEVNKLNLDKDKTYFIPKIEIDLGNINDSNIILDFENKFKIKFIKKLNKLINKSPQKHSYLTFEKLSDLEKIDEFKDLSNVKDSDFFALKYFLIKSYFPWWFDTQNINIEELIFKYSNKLPSSFVNFIFSKDKKDRYIKLLRLFNLMSYDSFLTFFNQIIINKHFKQRTDIKKVVKIAEANLLKTEYANVLFLTLTEFSPSPKLIENETEFINIFSNKLDVVDTDKQIIILQKAKSELIEDKKIKIIEIFDKIIESTKTKIPNNFIKKLEKRNKDILKKYQQIIKKSKFFFFTDLFDELKTAEDSFLINSKNILSKTTIPQSEINNFDFILPESFDEIINKLEKISLFYKKLIETTTQDKHTELHKFNKFKTKIFDIVRKIEKLQIDMNSFLEILEKYQNFEIQYDKIESLIIEQEAIELDRNIKNFEKSIINIKLLTQIIEKYKESVQKDDKIEPNEFEVLKTQTDSIVRNFEKSVKNVQLFSEIVKKYQIIEQKYDKTESAEFEKLQIEINKAIYKFEKSVDEITLLTELIKKHQKLEYKIEGNGLILFEKIKKDSNILNKKLRKSVHEIVLAIEKMERFKEQEKEFSKKEFSKKEISKSENTKYEIRKKKNELKQKISEKEFSEAEIIKIKKELSENEFKKILKELEKELSKNDFKKIAKELEKELLEKKYKQILKEFEKELSEKKYKQILKELEKELSEKKYKQILKELEKELSEKKYKQILNEFETELSDVRYSKVTKELKNELSENEFKKIIKELEKELSEEGFKKAKNKLEQKYEKVKKELEQKLSKKAVFETEIIKIKKELEQKQKTLESKIPKSEIIKYFDKTGSKFEKTEDYLNLLSDLLKTYQQIDNKQDTKARVSKKFSLDLFSYEFISDLLFLFFVTNNFPKWSDKFYNLIKSSNRLHSDIQIVEYIFDYLREKYYQKFFVDFYSYISQPEINKLICENYPAELIFKILSFLYNEKFNLFNKLFTKINSYLKNNNELTNHKKLLIINNYFIIKYKNIYDNLTENNIGNIFNDFINEQSSKKPVIDKSKDLLKLLITTGKLPEHLNKISKVELFELIDNFNRQFWIDQFQTDLNRLNFVTLFPENFVILVLQKLYGDNFSLLNKIWQELNIIMSKLGISKKQRNELLKYLYIIAFEIIIDNITNKQLWHQKYYSSLKNIFSSKFPKIKFENDFISIANSAEKQRIIVFENFIINTNIIFINSSITDNYIDNNLQIINFHFQFYLKYGYFHWSFPYLSLKKFANLLNENTQDIVINFKTNLLKILKSKFALQRLFTIFPKKTAESFLDTLYNYFPINMVDIVKQDKINKFEELKNLFPDSEKEGIYERIIQEKIDWINEPEEKEKIYINNGGLVILCNFLSFLFKRTKLIIRKGNNHEFIDEQARERAVLLTQYLITGNEDFKEHNLVINKIICGVELQKPININLKLTEKEKKEAELLLKSVIGHWKILGSTSIDGLRHTFLKREAVITFNRTTYNIKVEQKAIDVLLTKLPWTFQTIKLSWNNYVIFVEWNA